MSNVSKDEIENSLHRRFAWHEYADKGEYVTGGKFKDAGAIEVLVRHVPSTRENQAYVKCAGTRDMEPIEKFADGAMCLGCLERSLPGLLAWSAANTSRFAWDLTSSNLMSMHAGQIVVPAGCPHATSSSAGAKKESETAGDPLFCEEKYYASAIVSSVHGKSMVPHSWKITRKPGKLTLSIQYRSRYFNGNKLNTSQRSMYCHICCNTGNGQTHISDIHSQDAGRRRTGLSDAPMETLTFVGRSEMLKYMPSFPELVPALKTLREALVDELSRQGLPPAPVGAQLPSNWGSGALGTSHEDASDLLYSIAVMNRFPRLGRFPLPPEYRDVVALYVKRRFDKLPRDVSPASMLQALNLQWTPLLAKETEEHPDWAFLPVMLSEWGFSAEDIEKLAKDGFSEVFDVLKSLVSKQTKHRRTYQMFDMLSIVAPAVLTGAVPKQHGIASTVSLVLMEDADKCMKRMVSEHFKPHAKRFRKFNETWKTEHGHERFKWSTPDEGCCIFADVSSPSTCIRDISMMGTWYLDRRAWSKNEARKYVQWLKEHPLVLRDGTEEEAGDEEHRRIANTIRRATRFSFCVVGMRNKDYSQRACKAFYEWAYKNDVEVLLKIDSGYFYQDRMGRKARKNIEKRVEKKRKAKRDAKAKKQG